MALSQKKQAKLQHRARLATLQRHFPRYPMLLDSNLEHWAAVYLRTGSVQGYMVEHLAGRTDVAP